MISAVKCERCEAGYLLPRLPTVIGDIYSLQHFYLPSTFPTLGRISMEMWQLWQGWWCLLSPEQTKTGPWRDCWKSSRGQPKSYESDLTVREKSSSKPLSDPGHQGDYYSTSHAINCCEQVEQRLRFNNSSKVWSHQNFYLDEKLIEDLRLRTELFSHVAKVLKMVDSKGTNWEQRLESFQMEEKETVMRISSQG